MLGCEALGLRAEAAQLRFELLYAGAFHLRCLVGGAERAAMRFPALLPLQHGALGVFQRRGGVRFGVLHGGELRRKRSEFRAHCRQLLLVPGAMRGKVREGGVGLGEIGALALAQLAGVLDALLKARNVRADLVVAPLHGRQRVAVSGVHDALLLDRGLRGALCGELGLHGELAFAHCRVMHFRATVEVTQAQCQHFRRQPPLLFLQCLVAACRGGLALQVADLLVHLVAQVLQPLEVLTRLGDACLGLLAALLVARDPRRLLDEGAHVLRPRVDDARDHALLDDGVAARA